MAVLGWCYGFAWKKAVTVGGPWSSQYVVISALSIYLVMQTMESVIFRTLLLSIPCWLIWRWALRAPAPQPRSHKLPQPINSHEVLGAAGSWASKGIPHA
jgi:hypothetical protein